MNACIGLIVKTICLLLFINSFYSFGIAKNATAYLWGQYEPFISYLSAFHWLLLFSIYFQSILWGNFGGNLDFPKITKSKKFVTVPEPAQKCKTLSFLCAKIYSFNCLMLFKGSILVFTAMEDIFSYKNVLLLRMDLIFDY